MLIFDFKGLNKQGPLNTGLFEIILKISNNTSTKTEFITRINSEFYF